MDNMGNNPDYFILRAMAEDNKELASETFWVNSFETNQLRWFQAGRWVERWMADERCFQVGYKPLRVCTCHEDTYESEWEEGWFLDD